MIKSILIDASHYRTEAPTGVEYYVSSLLPALSDELTAKGTAVAWVGHTAEKPAGVPKHVEWVTSPYRRFWSQTALLKVLKERRPDLYFSPSGLMPFRYQGNTAVTVHDLAVYHLPEAYSFGQWIRLRFLMKRAAKQAAVIITPSITTQKEIMRHWKILANRIAVTPLAVPAVAAAPEAVDGVSRDHPYFLFVGRIELKKNLDPVIRGFAKLPAAMAARLVLAGKDGYGAAGIHRQIAKLPEEIRNRVIATGYVSESGKQWLLEHAHAVVVPGLSEGFGLPVLEAFTAGVPAICAQAGSLVEVGADAVLYAQGDIATDWDIQMAKLLEDQGLRKECVEKGKKYAGNYRWQKTAELTANAFLQVEV
ncbi:glycosyltransferase family 4 protein [Patescibacteria group bacterium]|nr:glycosyltransferase family 4 protein [Patescibacteria group bacterium]